MRGTDSISAMVVNSFMPMGVVRRRNSRFNESINSAQSKWVWSVAMVSLIFFCRGRLSIMIARFLDYRQDLWTGKQIEL